MMNQREIREKEGQQGNGPAAARVRQQHVQHAQHAQRDAREVRRTAPRHARPAAANSPLSTLRSPCLGLAQPDSRLVSGLRTKLMHGWRCAHTQATSAALPASNSEPSMSVYAVRQE